MAHCLMGLPSIKMICTEAHAYISEKNELKQGLETIALNLKNQRLPLSLSFHICEMVAVVQICGEHQEMLRGKALCQLYSVIYRLQLRMFVLQLPDRLETSCNV